MFIDRGLTFVALIGGLILPVPAPPPGYQVDYVAVYDPVTYLIADLVGRLQ